MTRRGVFAVDRGIWEHPMFAPEPFTEREAFQWMISEAVWEPKRVRVGRAVFDLERGQLVYATRFMATKWKWSEARVRRFLKRLENDAAVVVLPTREATQITICNYDKWQFGRRSDVSANDAPRDATPTQPRRKEEEFKNINNQEQKKESSLRSVAREGWPNDAFDRFYERYPHKIGRKAAETAFLKAEKTCPTFDRLMAGLERYIESKPADRAWCNPATWLNQARWDDKPALALATFRGGAPPGTRPMTAIELELQNDLARRGQQHDPEPSFDNGFLDLAANPAGPADRH